MPFDSPDVNLGDLLDDVRTGKAQLPDFQREWKWDSERIASLLASISLDYPVGVLMTLEVGGDDVRFKPRPIAGVDGSEIDSPETLILDGQQRTTSLFQALRAEKPVDTMDTKKKKLQRWYYIDMKKALDPEADREDAIVAVPDDRIVRADFGRTVVADYTTVENECDAEMFPLSRALDVGSLMEWQNTYIERVEPEEGTAAQRFKSFYDTVLKNFVKYTVPVIVLGKETPKEAVCTVFEKVNTGGVVLDVFELLTATFAADDFRLNDDWRDRKTRLQKQATLTKLESTDFLQAVTLISTYRKRDTAAKSGVDDLPAVSCRRKDILRLSVQDYKQNADAVTEGFEWASEFLAREKIFRSDDVPYRTQMIPLAAMRAALGKKLDERANDKKLRRWFWCGVLGELYGGAIETRFARDLEQLPGWLDGGTEPRTVYDSSFEASRLETLRTRNSAAYKGIYALLMKRGARDWLKANEIDVAAFFDLNIDIHHIFPRKWCDDRNIDSGRRDSIINKTPLSWDTNRSIGGRAPSAYIETVKSKSELADDDLKSLLNQHLVDLQTLRDDDFDEFYKSRKDGLLEMIAKETGKEIRRDDLSPEEIPEYEPDAAEAPEFSDVEDEIVTQLST